MLSAWSTYGSVLLVSVASLFACTRLSPGARRRPRDIRRTIALIVVLTSAMLILVSPLDELSDRFFSAHMVEHELLLFTMPTALLASRPLPVALIAAWRLLASGRRRSFARGWNWSRRTFNPRRYFAHPATAFAISSGVLWLWHAPVLYDLALGSEWVHTLEHLSFLLSALLYWRPLLGKHTESLDSNAKRALYLVAGGMQGGLLAALIALDKTILYKSYLQSGLSLHGALMDQQLGGLIMWFSGPVFYAALAAIVMEPGKASPIAAAGVASGDAEAHDRAGRLSLAPEFIADQNAAPYSNGSGGLG